jgi:Flp pilus assembly protein TadB
MNSLLLLAYHHGYSGGGMTHWLSHMVLSSVVHGLIYGLIFKAMHHLTLVQAVVLVAVVLCCLFMWSRSRDRRGW